MAVLGIELAGGPDSRKLALAILNKLGVPAGKPSPAVLEARCLEYLARAGVQMIVVDEVQHLIASGPKQQRILLNTLKHLSNMLRVSLVCAGTQDALAALTADAQVASRFQHVGLERWKLDDAFLRFIGTVEALMPLRLPSKLADESIANCILTISQGNTGEIMRLLNNAAVAAVQEGQERITLDILARADIFMPALDPTKQVAGRRRRA
jgi:hypothetical protein